MNPLGAAYKNLLLVVVSVLLVFGLTLPGDRVLGVVMPGPQRPDTLELLFPPNAEQSFQSVDFEYTANINSLGLRERPMTGIAPGMFTIAAIGDSFTYGWGVDAEDTWLRRVEKRLLGDGYAVRTINMAKPGVGPPFYADLAERAIPILRPDLLLVVLTQGNDIGASGPEGLEDAAGSILDSVRVLYPNIVRIIREQQMPPYEERTQERPPPVTTAEANRQWTQNTAEEFLENMPPEHRARFDAFDEEVKEAFLSGNLNPFMIDLALQNPAFYKQNARLDWEWTQQCIDRTAAHLERIKDVADLYGVEVVVLSVPEGVYVNEHAYKNLSRVGYETSPEMLLTENVDKAIGQAAEQAGLPFYPIAQAFTEHKDDPELFFELDGHLTPKGHALYAEALAPVLKDVIGPPPE